MMTPVCPRLLNMITDFVLLRFCARASEYLSAIEVILLLLLLLSLLSMIGHRNLETVSMDQKLHCPAYYHGCNFINMLQTI